MEAQDRKQAERVRDAAAQALARRFAGPHELQPEQGGLSNHVFRSLTSDGEVVVRVGVDVAKHEAFRREARVAARAREAQIPAPEVLCVTEEDGLAVMISRAMPGALARDHPERLRTLQDLGAMARRIHAIRTCGFGGDFSFDGMCAQDEEGWREWLLADYRAEARIATLARQQLISGEQAEEMRRALEQMAGLPDAPVLNHGDLRLKNVLVDEDGAITGLLDWENCRSARGPYWDISVALHDLWVDQAQAFLDGYGMEQAEVQAAAPLWRLFNALNYVPEVTRALQESDTETLERIRTRFSGALDLFGQR